jgi:Type I restriction-modification system methyltransferase subunit
LTADAWGRYYTAQWIGECLIDAMQIEHTGVIVELGAGQGALAAAASNRWQSAKVVTVDLDRTYIPDLGRPVGTARLSHDHHVHDALDDALGERIGLPRDSVDVGVCNPPYVRPRWRKSFGLILEDAGLSGSLRSVHDAGADLLFIAQNLRLLRPGGKLGLILPDGLITAGKFEGVRRTLLGSHVVEQVIQLPRRVFSGTEAQTYLVVLSKGGGGSDSVALREIRRDGSVSDALQVPPALAQRRLDYIYHAAVCAQQKPRRSRRVHLRAVVQSVTRGSFSSQHIEHCDWPVFHLSNFDPVSLEVPRRFRLSQRTLRQLPEGTRISETGDILVARVGRNLHEKIAIVEHGPCVVSDCVFSIRVSQKERLAVLTALADAAGREALRTSAHGVGAKFLSVNDLLELEVNL